MHSAIYLVAMIIAGLIGFLLGISLHQVTPETTWLYDYQALVAGFMAIAAAGVTITAMTWIDFRQQKRHEDLMRLNLRRDRLRFRRAAVPVIERVSDIRLPGIDNGTAPSEQPQIADALVRAWQAFRASKNEILEIRELLDERAMAIIHTIELLLSQTDGLKQTAEFIAYSSASNNDDHITLNDLNICLNRIRNHAIELCNLLQEDMMRYGD